MRVLTVVGRAASTISLSARTPSSLKASRNRSAPASAPRTPMGVGVAPSVTRFDTTLPAPPSASVCLSTSTTGTGASGEILRTRPQINSSSITSPSTTMCLPVNWSAIDLARCGVRFFMIECDSSVQLRSPRLTFEANRGIGPQSQFQDFINGGGNLFPGNLLDQRRVALELRPVAPSPRRPFALHYPVRSFSPRMPDGRIGRTPDGDNWTIERGRYMHWSTVIPHKHKTHPKHRHKLFQADSREHGSVDARSRSYLACELLLTGACDYHAQQIPTLPQ